MKVLVTGATGTAGRRVAAELARATEVEALTLAGRDGAQADRLARILGGGSGKARGLHLDVADRTALVDAARGADVVVGCAGPAYLYELDSIRAAIEAEASYVSLCDDHQVTGRVLAMHDAALGAGITIVSGCGMSPGLTNLLVALAASGLDVVEEIEIALGISSADARGEASALHLARAMASDAPTLSDHDIAVERAATSPKLVYFPEPVGWVETFRSGHPEVATMPRLYPGLRAMHVRIGLTEKVAMDVVRASAAAGLLGSEAGRRRWLRFTQPFRPMIEALPPRGAQWTAARVDVRGSSGGRSTIESLAVVDRITNLAAIPMARAALRIGSGATKTGVLSPEEIFDAREFLRDVAARGVRVARLEPETV